MKPYYEHAGITIYHGDCLDVLPVLTGIAALVTDPPYGIDLGKCGDDRGGSHGMKHRSYDCYTDSYENFVTSIVPRLNAALDCTDRGLVWTGPHIHEQRKPTAIGGVYCPAGAGRHSWGFKTFLPVLLYGTAPELNKGASVATTIRSSSRPGTSTHPCPKPTEWMSWSVSLASRDGDVVVDPFMGSGTTLVAAKDLGRCAIGIEISERYCEIAANRLSQEVLPL